MSSKKQTDKWLADARKCHIIYHKFSNWLVKTYGKDLHDKWQVHIIHRKGKKPLKSRYRGFNELELSRRLVGYEVMVRVERYIKRYCPEIKIIHCDDALHAGSDILLIPHPAHGITVIFIPQCTTIQNQFFLYENHCTQLIEELTKMKKVYKKVK